MKHLPVILFFSMLLACCKSSVPETKVDFYSSDNTANLYAFIGEQLAIKKFIPIESNKPTSINSKKSRMIYCISTRNRYRFELKYKVIKSVFNELKTDTVDFVVMKNYTPKEFQQSGNVILYLSKDTLGNFYYQGVYDHVSKNTKGIWKGENRESTQELFEDKMELLKNRGIFK